MLANIDQFLENSVPKDWQKGKVLLLVFCVAAPIFPCIFDVAASIFWCIFAVATGVLLLIVLCCGSNFSVHFCC